MTTPINTVQILRDAGGQPAFAVIPFAEYQALILCRPELEAEPGIPLKVVDNALEKEISAARAWREYLKMTQEEVAKRMGIAQSSYAELESKQNIRKSSRIKIAAALGIHETQLDF